MYTNIALCHCGQTCVLSINTQIRGPFSPGLHGCHHGKQQDKSLVSPWHKNNHSHHCSVWQFSRNKASLVGQKCKLLFSGIKKQETGNRNPWQSCLIDKTSKKWDVLIREEACFWKLNDVIANYNLYAQEMVSGQFSFLKNVENLSFDHKNWAEKLLYGNVLI